MLLREVGQPASSIDWYRQALELDPTCAEAHYNLAVSLQELKRAEEELEHLRRAVTLKPGYADAHNSLANLLQKRGELEQAEEHYRQAGRFSRNPANIHSNFGQLLQNQGRVSEAIEHFREAVRLKPDNAATRNSLGSALWRMGQFEEGTYQHEEAYRLQPNSSDVLNNLAGVYQSQGNASQAVALYDEAIRLQPDEPALYSNLILTFVYAAADFPATELVRRARDFGERVAAPLLRERAFSNVVDPDRRLRVGFVSGDFRKHSVNYFFEPLLLHLDRQQFEVFAYSNSYVEDAVTARLKESFDHWRNIRPLDDDAAADLIEADRIDILVDLSGHTAGNRLLVFAHKPAPIQVTWMGFSATTGMRAMDYRITDVHAEPAGMTEHLNVETLWRLPRVTQCYQGSANGPEVIDHPPRDGNGYVTFGCFNNFARVSDRTLATWGRIMARLSDARLLLEIVGLDSTKFRAELEERLMRCGLPLDRVILEPRSPANQFVLYNKIDIALDPFPAGGGATSMDTLWMGVPLVTLAGNSFASRMGVTFLTNAGLPELIAADEDQYVEIAVALATDNARLRTLRHNLRERVVKSPVMDQALFARDMEDAYRGMWRIWCQQQDKRVDSAVVGNR